MTKNSKLKEIVLSAARRFFSKFLQSDLKGNRDRRGCSVWRDLERCNERCFVWASVTSLLSVTWWIYNRHQGTSEVYRRWLQIIRWTCNDTRGCNLCFLSGTSNFAARGQCVRGTPWIVSVNYLFRTPSLLWFSWENFHPELPWYGKFNVCCFRIVLQIA